MSELRGTRAAKLITSREMDPQVVSEQRAEDFNLHAVPTAVRLGKFSLNMSMWALLSSANFIVFGALMAYLVGTVQALIGMVLSVIVFSLINIPLLKWSTRSGVGTAMMSRRLFGNLGAALTPLLLGLTAVYFVVFECSVLAVAFQAYFKALDIRIWYAIVMVVLVPFMMGSVQTWMGKLNGLLLPIYAGGLIAAVVVAAIQTHNGTGWLSYAGAGSPTSLPGWLQTVLLYMGLWLFMVLTVDFGRMGREQDVKFNQNVTFGWVFYCILFLFNGVVGVYLGRTVVPQASVGEANVVRGVIAVLGVVGLVVFIATQTRISTMNFYIGGVNLDRFAARVLHVNLGRRAWVVVIAVVAFLLMLTNVFSYLRQALAWQAVFFVSWVGIAMAHYLSHPLDRKYGIEFRPGRVRPITSGLVVWVASSVIGVILTVYASVFGMASTLAPIIVLVISVAGYIGVDRLSPWSALLERGDDPRDEVDDVWNVYIKCHVCERSYSAVEMDRDPSAGLAAICAACAESRPAFLKAVQLDSDPEGVPNGRMAFEDGV